MAMQRAIFTDIDGTLFRNDLTIGEKTKEALRKAYGMGVPVVLTSGRYIPGMERAAEQLEIPVIYAAINGALIKSGKEYLRRKYLESDAYRKAASYLRGKVSSLIVFCETRYAIDSDDEWFSLQTRICGEEGVRMDISDLDGVIERTGERPYKILAKDRDREKLTRLMEEVRPLVGNSAAVISSGDMNFEVMPCGVDKRDALAIVSSHLGISVSDTIAFGDWDNDAGMLRKAGTGIAMANASQRAKEAASFITLSNEEDGIAYALGRFLFSKE